MFLWQNQGASSCVGGNWFFCIERHATVLFGEFYFFCLFNCFLCNLSFLSFVPSGNDVVYRKYGLAL